MKKYTLGLGILTLIIGVFYWCAFYPGYMSFDSAYHYQQLESGEWTNFQPVIILLFWHVTNTLVEGPGGLFALFLLIYSLSLFLISYTIKGGWLQRVIIVLIPLSPVSIMLFPHIWKDIGLLVFVLLSVGLLLLYLSNHRKWPLFLSLITLLIGLLFRFESILYLWPLLLFQMWHVTAIKTRENNTIQWRHLLRSGFFVMLFSVVALLSNKALVKVSNTKEITLWPTIALWDIARVSIRENNVLLPDFTVGHGMTVDDLAQATHNWTNTSLFSSTKSGINNGLYTPYLPEQYRQLMNIWISLPIRYPISYAKHRLQLTKELMRVKEDLNKPQDLFWSNYIAQYNDRFPVNNSTLNTRVNTFLRTQKNTLWFKPWLYFIVAIAIVLYLLTQQKQTIQQRLAIILTICGLLSIAVMAFLAPAAEQRYLIIFFHFVPLSLCLAWNAQRKLL